MTCRIKRPLCFFLILSILFSIYCGCPTAYAAEGTADTAPAVSPSLPVELESEPTQALQPGKKPGLPSLQSQKPTVKPDLPSLDTLPKTNVPIPTLTCKESFVFDLRTGEFLYSSCLTGTSLYPASITKLFTSYMALRYLKPRQLIVVGDELSYVASDTSRAGFRAGDLVSVETLLYGTLLPSGCDAAYILATATGRAILKDPDASVEAALEAYLEESNRTIAELGITNTHIASADGYYDPEHYISIQGFAKIAQLCMENETIFRIASTPVARVFYRNAAGNRVTPTYYTTNLTIRPSGCHHMQAVGLKTGYNSNAGYCLLGVYRVEGGYLLVGVFGCATNAQRFHNANRLFNAFAPYV